MLTWLVYGLLVLLFCGLVIVRITYANVRMMPGFTLVEVRRPAPAEEPWARLHEFRFVGSFESRNTTVASTVIAWQHATSHTFFCVHIVGRKRVFDFATDFEDDVSLTTSNIAGGQMFPKPLSSYTESLPDRGLDELWAAHRDSIAFLVEVGGAMPCRETPAFLDSFVGACRRQMEYVSQIPLYGFRGPYWFLVRRHRRKNVSIRQQYGLGWIQLPRDLGSRPPGESTGP